MTAQELIDIYQEAMRDGRTPDNERFTVDQALHMTLAYCRDELGASPDELNKLAKTLANTVLASVMPELWNVEEGLLYPLAKVLHAPLSKN